MRKPRTFFRIDAWEPDGTFIGAWMKLPTGQWMEIIMEVSIERDSFKYGYQGIMRD